MKTVILTGGLGFLGERVARKFLNKGHRVIFVVRPKQKESAEERVKNVLGKNFNEASCIVKSADLTDASLGFDDKDMMTYQGEILGVYHLGAHLSFKSKHKDAVFDVNIGGTRNVLNLATKLKAPVFFVSTAYVHGNKKGINEEAGVIRPEKFNNTYEESKYEAEKIVQKWGEEHDYIIFRPSIILDDAHDNTPALGFYNIVFSLYRLKKFFYLLCNKGAFSGVFRFIFTYLSIPIIVSKDATANLIPVNIVADWIIDISKDKKNYNKHYHLVNNVPYSVASLMNTVIDAIDLPFVVIGMPRVISKSFFNVLFFISKPFPLLHKPLRVMSYYQYYLNENIQFDMKNVYTALGEERVEKELEPTHSKQYIQSITYDYTSLLKTS